MIETEVMFRLANSALAPHCYTDSYLLDELEYTAGIRLTAMRYGPPEMLAQAEKTREVLRAEIQSRINGAFNRSNGGAEGRV